MSKKVLYSFIFVLLVFNGLFITNGLLEARSKLFTTLVSPLKKSMVEHSPEKLLNQEVFNFIASGEERFYILTIIQERGCSSCIRNEIEALNAVPIESRDQIITIYIGSNKDDLKASGLTLDYLYFDNIDAVFDKPVDINTLNPISIIADKNFIYDLRKVDLTKPKSDFLTQSFYQKVESLLSY